MVDEQKSKLLKEFGFAEEVAELAYTAAPPDFLPTGFPKSMKRYHLQFGQEDMSVEEPYYWVLNNLRKLYPVIEKIEDTFSASENSAFFGVAQQRLGIQQDKVGQYLATIGKMIKELFQMVRELRILDERITYYGGSKAELGKEIAKRDNKDEIVLKGIFIDLVQGGGKSPASVYGMARELEFVTLPDLFFDAPPLKTEELTKYIDNLTGFNMSVRRVLKRHLRHYIEWRNRTHTEHFNRKGFMLKYLRQHYEIIQMYITWIKPYLKNAKRLTSKAKHQDSPDLIGSFEGAMMDIELLVHHPGKTHCVLFTFNYRTRPHMKFVQEGYQRGPVHVGLMDMFIRIYNWDKETIAKYKKMKEKESLMLIGDISQSVQEAMTGLGDELESYLIEAEGKVKHKDGAEEKKAKAKAPKETIMRKLFGDFMPPPKKIDSAPKVKTPKKLSDGKGLANFTAWTVYNTFKKAHRMITW
jgi:hypothetical protein